MLYSFLADLVVVVHFLFILFVMLGGLLLFHHRRIVWFHLPAVFWAIMLEVFAWPCPLTPLENVLRNAGGDAGYEGSFIFQYLWPVIYPAELNRNIQFFLATVVVVVNLIIYGWWWRTRK